MKTRILTVLFIAGFTAMSFAQQDKSQRASPPDSVQVTTNDGVAISIHYSKPSLKGRQLGVDLAPLGQVWRTGANEATTFEVDKDVLIQGERLPAGIYGLYSIPDEHATIVIFNSVWKQWGSNNYDESQDALRVTASQSAAGSVVEQFTIKAGKDGKVTLNWGEVEVAFTVVAAN